MLCQDCDQYEFSQKKGRILITERCKIGEDWTQEGLQGCKLKKASITKKAKELQKAIDKEE